MMYVKKVNGGARRESTRHAAAAIGVRRYKRENEKISESRLPLAPTSYEPGKVGNK